MNIVQAYIEWAYKKGIIISSFKDAVKAMQQAGIMMRGDGNKFCPKDSAVQSSWVKAVLSVMF